MRRYDYDWDFYLLIGVMLLFSLILFFEGQRKLNSIVSSTAILIEEKFENYQEKTLTTVSANDIIENENVTITETDVKYGAIYYPVTEEEKYILYCTVAGEAGNQSFDGKAAVAQCLLNAMKKDGLTANEVIKVYQYAGWNEELQYSNPEAWENCKLAVDAVFDVGFKLTDENILWFYNPDIVYSGFHESQKYVMTIGAHKFFAPLEDNNG